MSGSDPYRLVILKEVMNIPWRNYVPYRTCVSDLVIGVVKGVFYLPTVDIRLLLWAGREELIDREVVVTCC